MAATTNSASFESLRVRHAASHDVVPLTRLINAAFVVESVVFDGDRVDAHKVRRYMETGTFLLLENGADLAGCVYVEIQGVFAYLGLLSVDPSRQRSGLGRKLVTAAEDFARAKGCQRMDLRVISQRAQLLPFYQRLGYTETGTAPFAPNLATKVPSHYILLAKALSDSHL